MSLNYVDSSTVLQKLFLEPILFLQLFTNEYHIHVFNTLFYFLLSHTVLVLIGLELN